MSRSTSSFSSAASSQGRPLFPMMDEYIQTLSPSRHSDATSETRLQQHHRRFPLRDSNLVISTAISSTGWLVTATMSDICLYDLNDQVPTKDFKPLPFPVKMKHKHEKIRAVAISDQLLAVITHYRLLVYEYGKGNMPEENVIPEILINKSPTWTPKSVAILQTKACSIMHQTDVAWVAVGGEGVNAVKLFTFSKDTSWTRHHNHITPLQCHSATSSIRNVGFSQFLAANRFIVFGVTCDNRVLCWEVSSNEFLGLERTHSWEVDIEVGHNALSHRAEITSVSIFRSPSPSGRPYLFCAVNQKHGSQQLRSFLTPFNKASTNLYSQASDLPETAVGRHVLAGAVTRNGHFLVIVEERSMKLLTLQGAQQGGLTCVKSPVEWGSSLRSTVRGVTGISLLLKEEPSRLRITAVDGRGHLAFATVVVPDMPISDPPSLGPQLPRMTPELATSPIIRELSATELNGTAEEDETMIAETSANELNGAAMEDEIMIGLG